jgi:hypothetical protein
LEDLKALRNTIKIELIKIFYLEFNCSVGSSSDAYFLVKSGVRQGCVMSALLFTLAIDWVMKSTLSGDNTGIRWTLYQSCVKDLDNADDLVFLSHLEKHMQSKTSKLQSNTEKIATKFNMKKTEVMSLNTKQTRIHLDGNNLSNTSFTYLGSIVTPDGGADKDIKIRLSKA